MPRPQPPYKTKRIMLTIPASREADFRAYAQKLKDEETLKSIKARLEKK